MAEQPGPFNPNILRLLSDAVSTFCHENVHFSNIVHVTGNLKFAIDEADMRVFSVNVVVRPQGQETSDDLLGNYMYSKNSASATWDRLGKYFNLLCCWWLILPIQNDAENLENV